MGCFGRASSLRSGGRHQRASKIPRLAFSCRFVCWRISNTQLRSSSAARRSSRERWMHSLSISTPPPKNGRRFDLTQCRAMHSESGRSEQTMSQLTVPLATKEENYPVRRYSPTFSLYATQSRKTTINASPERIFSCKNALSPTKCRRSHPRGQRGWGCGLRQRMTFIVGL